MGRLQSKQQKQLDAVDSALSDAKAAIDEIKSDAQLAAEALAAAKTSAKAELDDYVNLAEYTTNKDALEAAIADGKTAIEGSSKQLKQ